MFLSDKNIGEMIESGKIIIEPEFDKKNIRTAGVRVHLNEKILIPKPGQTIDLKNPTELEYDEHSLKDGSFTLEPGQFILASTFERIQMDRSLLAFIDGRSTIGRLGLTVHLSSTTLDGNYEEPRVTTYNMKNEGNFSIIMNYKDAIGMVVFAEIKDAVVQDPQSQYQGQGETTAPNMSFRPGEDK